MCLIYLFSKIWKIKVNSKMKLSIKLKKIYCEFFVEIVLKNKLMVWYGNKMIFFFFRRKGCIKIRFFLIMFIYM